MSSVLFILSKILPEHYFDLTGKIPIPAGCGNYALQPAHLPVVRIMLYNRPTCRLLKLCFTTGRPYTLYLLFTYKQVHQIETVYIDQTHVGQL
jgi:hypothetical protein